MLQDFNLIEIVEPLLEWFQENARVLPWREEPTPYRVWVSEIMLQQTRVEAVKPYFERFVKTLPDVKSLAECEEEKLLKLWEGLGYYNRVRNMQIAARSIMEEYQGKIPEDYEILLKLKGIGHYTAGAIASIAYGKAVPAVDGNVLRVITRVSADDSDIMKESFRRKVEEALKVIMPQERASAFNQALMELGAKVCIPNGEPLCYQCPWNNLCQAKKQELWRKIPVKKKNKTRKKEEKTIFVIRKNESVVLNKRPNKGLLAGLYEFPNVKGYLSEEEALFWIKKKNLKPLKIMPLEDAKHIFSHVEWHMKGYMVWIDELEQEDSKFLFVEVESSERDYPIPAAFSAYTKYMNIKLGNERFFKSV
ncbi:MAG: A/G-specific adenine glycosylase [Lachnospiraceae bacterium]|nr:A/G-specific adenine glycosylase [Lachnospiraceae bacterium]